MLRPARGPDRPSPAGRSAQGKRNAVPRGISVNPAASAALPRATPVATSPAARIPMPIQATELRPGGPPRGRGRARADDHTHRAEIHHEIADRALGDAEAVRQEQRNDLDGAVECTDADRVDPDQPRRRLVPAMEHVRDRRAPGRPPRGFSGRRRDATRLTEKSPGEDRHERRQPRRAESDKDCPPSDTMSDPNAGPATAPRLVIAESQPRLLVRCYREETSAAYACTTPMVPPPMPWTMRASRSVSPERANPNST